MEEEQEPKPEQEEVVEVEEEEAAVATAATTTTKKKKKKKKEEERTRGLKAPTRSRPKRKWFVNGRLVGKVAVVGRLVASYSNIWHQWRGEK